PLPVRPPGDVVLTVYHVPVRVRLVVVAPAGKTAGIDATAVEQVLDYVLPGLSGVTRHDRPRVRVWPPQLSHQGVSNLFHRCTHGRGREGWPSGGVLRAGRAQVGRLPLLLGLGLWAEEPNSIGRLVLEPHQWLDVLRLHSRSG